MIKIQNRLSFLLISSLVLQFTTIAVLITNALAADVEWRSETIFRFYERDTPTATDNKVFPLYEYLELDMRNLSGTEGLSIHLHGWGRADLGDGSYFSDDFDGSLLYGYLDYASEHKGFQFRAGRQYVFSGITNESIDGLLFKFNGGGFSISGYGGSPVSLETAQGRSGDSIFGGRLGHSLSSIYDLGISYEHITNNSNEDESRGGIDLALYLPGGNGIYGFSSYNIDTENVAEYSLEGRFGLSDNIEFRPAAQKLMFDDLLVGATKKVNVFNLVAAKNLNEILTVYGGLLTWHQSGQGSFGLKIKNFDYDKRGDSSQLYSSLLDLQPDKDTMTGLELGFMDGERPENQFLMGRVYYFHDGLMDKHKVFISGDLMYIFYDTPIYGVDHSLFISLGTGGRFLDDDLELKISGDYSIDPYFDKDLRGMLVLKYFVH